jgi:hypothetical protein
MYGLAPGSTPGYGGTFYVSFGAPFFFLAIQLPGTPGVPGEGDFDLTATLPQDPSLFCLHIYLQWFAEDPGAIWGFSMSNALDQAIGT